MLSVTPECFKNKVELGLRAIKIEQIANDYSLVRAVLVFKVDDVRRREVHLALLRYVRLAVNTMAVDAVSSA